MPWTSCAVDGRGTRRERGTVMVEFLAVTLLTVTCLLAVAQLALWVWARNVAVTAVHEGARTAAESGRSLGDGPDRARILLRDGLGASAAGFEVSAVQEVDEVAVRARGDAPQVLPFLPRFAIDVQAHAHDEDAVLP